jgi:hypothetical protein
VTIVGDERFRKNSDTCHLICNNFNLNFIFGIVCLCVCLCIVALSRILRYDLEKQTSYLCDSPLLWPCSRSMSPGHQQPWCRPNTDQQPRQWPTVATPSESGPTAGRWPGGAATRPRSSRTSLPLLTRTSAKPPPNTSTSQGKNLLFPVACLGEATCVRLLFYCSNWLDYCFSVQPYELLCFSK